MDKGGSIVGEKLGPPATESKNLYGSIDLMLAGLDSIWRATAWSATQIKCFPQWCQWQCKYGFFHGLVGQVYECQRIQLVPWEDNRIVGALEKEGPSNEATDTDSCRCCD